MNRIIRLKIQNYGDREKALVALGMSGHKVWIEEIEHKFLSYNKTYFLCIEESDDAQIIELVRDEEKDCDI